MGRHSCECWFLLVVFTFMSEQCAARNYGSATEKAQRYETVVHIVNPQTKLEDGLPQLLLAEDSAVQWLMSRGS